MLWMHCACQLYHASKATAILRNEYVLWFTFTQEHAAAVWNKILSPSSFKKISRWVRLRLFAPLFGTWDEQAIVAVSAMLALLKIDHISCSMGFTHFIMMRRVYWRCALTAQLVEWQAADPLGKVWFPVRVWILLCAPSCRTVWAAISSEYWWFYPQQ